MEYPVIDDNVVIEFDDFTDATTIRPHSGINASRAARKHKDWDGAGFSWLGVSGLAELERVVKDGWPQGVARINDALGKIGDTVVPVSIKRRTVRSDQGDEYDVHRAMSGGLDRAWSSRKRMARNAVGAEITIATQIGLASSDNPDEVFWRGAACIRLADILTEAGYNVRIIAYNRGVTCYRSGSKSLGKLFTCVAKQANAPLDMTSIASLVALAGVYRHYFLFNQLSAEFESESDYGVTDSQFILPGADVCIRKADVNSKATAIEFINKALAGMNEKAREAA